MISECSQSSQAQQVSHPCCPGILTSNGNHRDLSRRQSSVKLLLRFLLHFLAIERGDPWQFMLAFQLGAVLLIVDGGHLARLVSAGACLGLLAVGESPW